MGISIEVEDDDDEPSNESENGHLSLVKDFHKHSEPQIPLQNREQLPSAHKSETFFP